MAARTDSTADRTRRADRSRLGGASVLVVAGAFVLSAGAPGIAAAAAVLAVWFALPATYAFALGNVALAALVGSGDVVQLAVAEAGLLGVLLAPAGALDRPGRPVAIAVGGAAAGAALAWAASRGAVGLWVAGLAIVAATGLGGYGLHRYQLVELDSVGDASE
ncbi:hypothetical protein M0R89_19150 (plasmid) [Halorussus limi]|uniref:DUF8163 domain-containing protein n=1 Tax=Halorussus limi TaxID=2938695 RepID=A0A8U0I052_9EURY|nr:hypothetical protein [Halorussus limi]UPV76650.1 hypothetical protein M0R89_19150 [Halorussus limi]